MNAIDNTHKAAVKISAESSSSVKMPANDAQPVRKVEYFGKEAIVQLAEEMAQTLFG